MKINNIILYVLVILFVSCSNARDDKEKSGIETVNMKGDTLVIPAQSVLSSKLSVSSVGRSSVVRTMKTTGVVTPIPSAYAEVASPFSGRVIRSFVSIGQKVSAGTVLYELSSSEYFEMIKNYFQAENDFNLAKKTLDRVTDMLKNKVAAAKDLEEVQSQYDNAVAELKRAKAVLSEFQVSENEIESGKPMRVKSPISGTVIVNNLLTGDYHKEDDEAMVVVADLSKVWIKANVMENDALNVKPYTDVKVSLAVQPDSVVDGRIVYIGGILDPESRTLQTIIECPNTDGRMIPNMYANVHFNSVLTSSLIIPKTAVLQGDDTRYVYKKISDDGYLRCAVSVESVSGDSLLVLSGLSENDCIVTEGTFYLTDAK